MDRLRVSHDNLTIINKQCRSSSLTTPEGQILPTVNDQPTLTRPESESEKNDEIRSNQEITQILRVMIVLREYLNEFDANYLCERVYPPLCR